VACIMMIVVKTFEKNERWSKQFVKIILVFMFVYVCKRIGLFNSVQNTTR
jgi:hypothetical protein